MSTKDLRIPHSSVVGPNDEDVCWAVVDPIWPAAEMEDELAPLDQGTKRQQAIRHDAVRPGSRQRRLGTFFGNSSGMLQQHVKSGLQPLGAQEQMDLITPAIEAFPQGAPNRARDSKPCENSHKNNEIFGERVRAESMILADSFADLRPVWTQYIQTHPEGFFLPSDR